MTSCLSAGSRMQEVTRRAEAKASARSFNFETVKSETTQAPFMKTRSTRSLRRLLFKDHDTSASYADQIGQLEKALARKPEKLQLDIIGSGELSPDMALLMRSVLLNRSPKTHLITNARSSLQGGAVLVWLMGDTRLIREDAKLYFRKPNKEDEDEDE